MDSRGIDQEKDGQNKGGPAMALLGEKGEGSVFCETVAVFDIKGDGGDTKKGGTP